MDLDPFMSITSAPYRALASTVPFQCFPHHYSMATFFDDRVSHHAQSFDFFFHHFVLLSFKHISLCLYYHS